MAILRYFIILLLIAAAVPTVTYLLLAYLMKLTGVTHGRFSRVAYIGTILALTSYITWGKAKYGEQCRHIALWSVLMVLAMYGGAIWWLIQNIPTV